MEITEWSISDPEIIDGPEIDLDVIGMQIRSAIECDCCGMPFGHIFEFIEDLPSDILKAHRGKKHQLEVMAVSLTGIGEINEDDGSIGVAVEMRITCSCPAGSNADLKNLRFEKRKSFEVEEPEADRFEVD